MKTLSQTIRYKNFFDNYDLINKGFKIELMLDSQATEKLSKNKNLKKIKKFAGKKIISVHGASHSLDLGSKDKNIRNYSLDMILKGIKIAQKLGAKDYVFHSTCMPYMTNNGFKNWLEASEQGFDKIIKKCDRYGILPLIENTYEKDTKLFEIFFKKYKKLNFCFDIGHINCFSDLRYDEWLSAFKHKIKALHIHDNNGDEDSHLDLFKGNIDIKYIFDKIKHIKDIRLNLETSIDDFQYNAKKTRELIK